MEPILPTNNANKKNKIYVCDKCKLNFGNNYKSYYNHTHRKTSCVKSDIEDKVYKCDICNVIFPTSNSFWKHMNRKTSCLNREQHQELLNMIDIQKAVIQNYEETNRKNTEMITQFQDESIHSQMEATKYKAVTDLLEKQLTEHSAIKKEVEELKKRFNCNQEVGKVVQTTEPTAFLEYLHEYNLYQLFEDTFKGKEVCYNLIQKFISSAQKKRNVTGLQRTKIRYDQKDQCIKCSTRTIALEIDHIVPLYQGGNNFTNNLQGLCGTCHGEKTIREFMEFCDNIQKTCRYLYSKLPETK